jgi:3',5'-cyclic AMP phosphodiesterase CpdA
MPDRTARRLTGGHAEGESYVRPAASLDGRLVLAVLLSVWPATARFTVYPYLQNLTDSTVVVRWETDSLRSGLVQYGFTTGYGMQVEHSQADSTHELTMAGLTMDTGYHYRVISGSDTSADATFRSTASPDRPFRFFAYGDNRTDSAAHQSVIDRMVLTVPIPSLALNVGDLTENGTLPEYRTFFNVERAMLARLSMSPAPGNHDLRTPANWYRFFALPNNEQWYTVHFGNSVVHALNTYQPFTPGSEQYNWLRSELQADSADPQVRHVFVWFHEPPYTTNAAHSSNLEVRQYLCPLFERFGVRLVFSGHVHAYEHSLVNGVHYVVTGGGGAPLAHNWNSPEPWTVFRLTCYEFTLVDVRGDSVFCRSIQPDGTVFDSFVVALPQVGVSETARATTGRSGILGVRPSPARDHANISLALEQSGPASLKVYDRAGELVAVLCEGELPAGDFTLAWPIGRLPDGTYFCVLRTAHSTRAVPIVRTH